ncbi:hypothetical protein [Alteromonas sp. ASW11-130]|uniref:hypothetical protein n=1 Tax=Alteromonas sp. ASW11-130 TaxID=3015775 RepID=UPI002242054B|nr:hypothetical protein [Alteromonas sp. ASW11-130]MCW8092726.1 hypothetical protein [Alteromonas sp. ASW11-130]
MKSAVLLTILTLASLQASATKPSLTSHPSHQAFFDALTALCGQAFTGKVVADTTNSDTFKNKSLVMHVSKCDDKQINIPFHVGEDHSRTWIITRTGSGLRLKHDHRHEDGSEDPLTMYGGVTTEPGFNQVQAFPADAYTKWMFAEKGLPQSIHNIWKMFVYPDIFSYQLVREGREFRVDFDLTKPTETPPAAWGAE